MRKLLGALVVAAVINCPTASALPGRYECWDFTYVSSPDECPTAPSKPATPPGGLPGGGGPGSGGLLGLIHRLTGGLL